MREGERRGKERRERWREIQGESEERRQERERHTSTFIALMYPNTPLFWSNRLYSSGCASWKLVEKMRKGGNGKRKEKREKEKKNK